MLLKKQSVYFLLAILVVACNRIDKSKLKVIDDIPLGTTVTEFDSTLSKLNIERETFLTSIFFTNYDFRSRSVTFPYSTTFDISNYRSDKIKHLGLLYPFTLEGTDNIIKLAVVLAHTESPYFVLPNDVEPQDVSDEYTSLSQHISTKVIDAIERMYTSKYGKPTDTITMPIMINFFKFDRNQLKTYKPPEIDNVYEVLVWETDDLRIRLFKGVPSTEEKFDTKTNSYQYTIYTNGQGRPAIREIEVDYNNGETMCSSYPYILYELKQEVIDKLKFDKKKI
jgi:hypothetical protein